MKGKQRPVRCSDFLLCCKPKPQTLTNASGELIVHQRCLSLDEKILRHFDLSSQYGVSRHLYFFLNRIHG